MTQNVTFKRYNILIFLLGAKKVFYFLLFVVVIVILVFFFILRNRSKKDTKPQVIEKKKGSIEKLLELNLEIRKGIFDTELIEKIESIIDKLRDILPVLNEKYRASELTWVANKMASNYLQKVIHPFIDFKKSEQSENKSSLMESLSQIEKELDETIALVNENKESDFDTKAKFIKTRFK